MFWRNKTLLSGAAESKVNCCRTMYFWSSSRTLKSLSPVAVERVELNIVCIMLHPKSCYCRSFGFKISICSTKNAGEIIGTLPGWINMTNWVHSWTPGWWHKLSSLVSKNHDSWTHLSYIPCTVYCIYFFSLSSSFSSSFFIFLSLSLSISFSFYHPSGKFFPWSTVLLYGVMYV